MLQTPQRDGAGTARSPACGGTSLGIISLNYCATAILQERPGETRGAVRR